MRNQLLKKRIGLPEGVIEAIQENKLTRSLGLKALCQTYAIAWHTGMSLNNAVEDAIKCNLAKKADYHTALRHLPSDSGLHVNLAKEVLNSDNQRHWEALLSTETTAPQALSKNACKAIVKIINNTKEK